MITQNLDLKISEVFSNLNASVILNLNIHNKYRLRPANSAVDY